MTAKEKAEKLVDSFLTASFGTMEEYVPVPKEFAKQCALIAVDEILNCSPTLPTKDGFGLNEFPVTFDIVEATEYWQQVKIEIENL